MPGSGSASSFVLVEARCIRFCTRLSGQTRNEECGLRHWSANDQAVQLINAGVAKASDRYVIACSARLLRSVVERAGRSGSESRATRESQLTKTVMSAFFNVAYWVGVNYESLLIAAAVALVLGLIAFAFLRRRGVHVWIVASAVFYLSFAAITVRNIRGYAYLLADDGASNVVALLFAASALCVGGVAIALRQRRRIALAVVAGGVLLIGSWPPMVKGSLASRGSAARAADDHKPASPTGSAPLWTSAAEGLAARFPEPPERISASTRSGLAYAYQGKMRFPNGDALLSISVAPVELRLADRDVEEFMLASHQSFLSSIAATSRQADFAWTTFGEAQRALGYTYDATFEGVAVVGRGVWVWDKDRIIRASTVYPRTFGAQQVDALEAFLDSFVLVSR